MWRSGKIVSYSESVDILEYDTMLPNEQRIFKALAKLLGYEELK